MGLTDCTIHSDAVPYGAGAAADVMGGSVAVLFKVVPSLVVKDIIRWNNIGEDLVNKMIIVKSEDFY